jgi:hypothetical protein
MSKFDEIRKTHSEQVEVPSFPPMSGCPTCHGMDGYAWAGRQKIVYCKQHRVYWFDGLDAWGPPFAESDAKQRGEWTELGLEHYTQVNAWFLGQVAAA